MVIKDNVENISGVRFSVSYLLFGEEEFCRAMAEDICVEQTVEFPIDLIARGDITEKVVGKVEEFSPAGRGVFRALISYALETAAGELTQLLNVIFGNISIKKGIKVEKVDLPDEMLSLFRGPRFGREGLRKLFSAEKRPMVCTALKPMGLSAEELAEQAYRFALGGIDMIKDDHGLSDQVFAPFEERLGRVTEAVARANRETGKSCAYVPNISAPADKVIDRARTAKKMGAGALLIAPGLVGIDTMRLISEDDTIALPVMAHPTFWGSYVTSPENGFSHYFLYGQLMRLAGADMSVFPNFGGRFSFTREECMQIVRGSLEPMGHIAPLFPAPGGGMTNERAPELLDVYGKDFVILIGGGLHRHSEDLVENSRYFAKLLNTI